MGDMLLSVRESQEAEFGDMPGTIKKVRRKPKQRQKSII